MQHSATSVPALVEAADRRVEVITQNWRGRLEAICENVGVVAGRAGALLAGNNLKDLDARELATMLKLMIDSLARLREEVHKAQTAPVDIQASPDWQRLRALILRALEVHPSARLAVMEAIGND